MFKTVFPTKSAVKTFPYCSCKFKTIFARLFPSAANFLILNLLQLERAISDPEKNEDKATNKKIVTQINIFLTTKFKFFSPQSIMFTKISNLVFNFQFIYVIISKISIKFKENEMLKKTYLVDDTPGSISNIYEIKILICRILNEIRTKMTKNQLNAALQLNETVNYFNFCQALKELLKSKHIIEKNNGDKKYLVLTTIGEETANILNNNLPKHIVEKNIKLIMFLHL